MVEPQEPTPEGLTPEEMPPQVPVEGSPTLPAEPDVPETPTEEPKPEKASTDEKLEKVVEELGKLTNQFQALFTDDSSGGAPTGPPVPEPKAPEPPKEEENPEVFDGMTPHQLYQRAKADATSAVMEQMREPWQKAMNYLQEVSAATQVLDYRMNHPEEFKSNLELARNVSKANPSLSVAQCFAQAKELVDAAKVSGQPAPTKAPPKPKPKVQSPAAQSANVNPAAVRQGAETWEEATERNFAKFFPGGIPNQE